MALVSLLLRTELETVLKHCPDAASNLLPELAVSLNGQKLESWSDQDKEMREIEHIKVISMRADRDKPIDCVLANDIFRI